MIMTKLLWRSILLQIKKKLPDIASTNLSKTGQISKMGICQTIYYRENSGKKGWCGAFLDVHWSAKLLIKFTWPKISPKGFRWLIIPLSDFPSFQFALFICSIIFLCQEWICHRLTWWVRCQLLVPHLLFLTIWFFKQLWSWQINHLMEILKDLVTYLCLTL